MLNYWAFAVSRYGDDRIKKITSTSDAEARAQAAHWLAFNLGLGWKIVAVAREI